MTRAEDRLIVCATQAKGEVPEGSWYAMVETGLSAAAPGLREVPAPDGDGMISRFALSDPPAAMADDPDPKPAIAVVPDWLGRHAPVEQEPAPPLRPSSALAAADAPERPVDGPFLAEAAAAGRFAHLLLQILPELAPAARPAAAAALGVARAQTLAPERRARLIADALALLAAPELAMLFGESALAEAPVAGLVTLPGGERRPVSGRIDRLAVTATEVVIADFKTTSRPPDDAAAIPESTLAQVAVYRVLLSQIYPGRRVRALLVYTATLSWLEPSPEALDAALAALATPS